MLFYEIEPFGQDTNYLGHAITASAIVNVNRGKGRKSYSPDEFMPKFERKKEGDISEAINFASVMTAAMGGKDERE